MDHFPKSNLPSHSNVQVHSTNTLIIQPPSVSNSSQLLAIDSTTPLSADSLSHSRGQVNFSAIYPPQAERLLAEFWPQVQNEVETLTPDKIRGNQELPIARIKRIMKLDPDVKMISSEVPQMFQKACEIFIRELTLRAWSQTEELRRRTMQKSDIAQAVNRYDQFDFLIDIVPREEVIKPPPQPQKVVRGYSLGDDALASPPFTEPRRRTGSAAASGSFTDSRFLSEDEAGDVKNVVKQNAPQRGADEEPLVDEDDGEPVPPQVYQQVTTETGEVQYIPLQLSKEQVRSLQLQLQQRKDTKPESSSASG